MKNTNTQIRLSESTYGRLKMAKQQDSFNDYVEKMLNYFAITQVNPESVQQHPIALLKSEIDRIIKILKSQEKRYVGFLQIIKDKTTNTETQNTENDNVVGNDLTVEELSELTQLVDSQKTELIELRKLNQKLTTENTSLKLQPEQSGENFNKKAIMEAVETLKAIAQPFRLAEGKIAIEKTEFNALLERILKECL